MSNVAHNHPLSIVIVGHVDHGKSSLVGRLIYETGSLPEGKYEAIRAMSERRGMPFEWAFLMDALQAERDQGITIDTAQVRFSTSKRGYVIIDAPGHKEFLKNMITGAASAEAALLLVDAEEGVREQTRRHAYLLHMLGIREVAVVVNKMDRVGWSEARFHEVAQEIRGYLARIGIEPRHIIPISAREGDGIAAASPSMPWYDGPAILEALDTFPAAPGLADRPLRLPVQDVYKFDERRIIAGRIESGHLRVGDRLLFSPSNKSARVATIEAWHADQPVGVSAGQSVGITLDEQIFVERGQIASLEQHPPVETNVFRARLFWLGRAPLRVGSRYKLKLATAEYAVEVQSIETVIEVGELRDVGGDSIERNGVGEVVLRGRSLMAVDEYVANPRTGRFVLVDGYDIVGGGIISMDGYADQRRVHTVRATNVHRNEHHVSIDDRWRLHGHKSGILWMTGLSGAGKSTLAFELERLLFRKGINVYVLDGDNVRHGLCADLSFSAEDRAENIRRVSEVANLFARAGTLVITAFISPYRSDRDNARALAGDMFHEVHVASPLDVCEQRDPKGLYAKARRSEIPSFTGISAPYEAPTNPELRLDTAASTVEDCLAQLLAYVDANFRLP